VGCLERGIDLMSWIAQQDPKLITGIIFASLALSLLGVMMALIQRRQSSHYEREMHRAVLSAMRESYEAQIASLTREMTATADRWKDANHLLVSAQTAPQQITSTPVPREAPFLKSFKLQDPDYIVDQKLILVLTPFTDEERETFEIIKKICNDAGFRCIRGDEEYTPTDILSHVVKLIVKARIVIGNISSRNPNVFYELGVAHTLGKQTVLVSKSLDDVPFDVAGLRILIWSSRQDLEQKLSQTLLRTVSDSVVQLNYTRAFVRPLPRELGNHSIFEQTGGQAAAGAISPPQFEGGVLPLLPDASAASSLRVRSSRARCACRFSSSAR
jgi:hypothetical protein